MGGVYRPLVPVMACNPIDKKEQLIWAILDTGADACILPKGIAEITGHNLKGDGVQQNINQGVGESKVSAWKHTFVLKLLTADCSSVAWKTKSILVDCLEHDNAPALIGWRDFMEHLNIRFNYATKRIIIEVP